MGNPVNLNLCPHGQAKSACLACFHNPQRPSAPSAARPPDRAMPRPSPEAQRVQQAVATQQQAPAGAVPVTLPQGQAVDKSRQAAGLPALREPVNVSNGPSYDDSKVWDPPRHLPISARQPSHPEAVKR